MKNKAPFSTTKFAGFEHEHMYVRNPTVSTCGRFLVSPEQYGFAIITTGGGCTAWRKYLDDGSHIVLTAGSDGVSHELGSYDDMFTLGFYENDEDDEGTIYKMEVGFTPT